MSARVAMLALVIGLAACGGGGSDAPGSDGPVGTAPPPVAPASSPIGPDQTATVVITGPNQASVSVPAGAAAVPVLVSVALAASAPALPTGVTASLGVYEITPHGTTFQRSVDVAIPFDPATIPAGERPIMLKAEVGGEWAALTDVRVEGSMLHASIAGFSYFAVTSCGSYEPSTCSTTPSISIGIAAPSISTDANAAITVPPSGSPEDVIGMVNAPIAIQFAARLTMPAHCIDGAEFSRIVWSTNASAYQPGQSVERGFVTLSTTGIASSDVVVLGTRTRDGVSVIDAIAYATLSPNNFVKDESVLVNAVARCAGSRANVNLFSSSVRLVRGVSAVAASKWSAQPMRIYESPKDTKVSVGQAATFFVSASDAVDTVDTTYHWERSDDGGASWVPIKDETQRRYVLYGARLEDNGSRYHAIANRVSYSNSTAAGFAISEPATLTVAAAPTDPANGVISLSQTDALIAAGGSATFAIKNNGSLWSWGANNGGVLGRASSANTPQPVDTLSNVRSVVSGAWYAIACLTSGDVYAWGWGGNIGTAIGSASLDNPLPVKVAGLASIRALATRSQHTLALDTAANVFGFGPEGSGALGPAIGNDGVRAIAGLSDVRQIAAGDAHSLALQADGTVWAWGSNTVGQLGVAADNVQHATPTAVPGLSDVVAIAASSFGSFALKRDGTVWSWGQAFVLGRTGASDMPAMVAGLPGTVASIGAGNYNVFAIDSVGRAFGWGDNSAGRVGIGTGTQAVAVPTPIVGLPVAAQVAGGEAMGLALTQDGRVFTWGSNGNDQLDGTARADSNAPVDSGFAR